MCMASTQKPGQSLWWQWWGSYYSSTQESFQHMKWHKPHGCFIENKTVFQVSLRETNNQLEKRRERQHRYTNWQRPRDIQYTRASEAKSRNTTWLCSTAKTNPPGRTGRWNNSKPLFQFFSAYTSHMEIKLRTSHLVMDLLLHEKLLPRVLDDVLPSPPMEHAQFPYHERFRGKKIRRCAPKVPATLSWVTGWAKIRPHLFGHKPLSGTPH